MDQVTDDNRRLGKISQLGRENIGFDATTTTSTGIELHYTEYLAIHGVAIKLQLLHVFFLLHYVCMLDTTKSNILPDTISSDEPASADLSGIYILT